MMAGLVEMIRFADQSDYDEPANMKSVYEVTVVAYCDI
jgi:mRNA-degrading endonuclease HigB of HigAB toxin-antitoxin module